MEKMPFNEATMAVRMTMTQPVVSSDWKKGLPVLSGHNSPCASCS